VGALRWLEIPREKREAWAAKENCLSRSIGDQKVDKEGECVGKEKEGDRH